MWIKVIYKYQALLFSSFFFPSFLILFFLGKFALQLLAVVFLNFMIETVILQRNKDIFDMNFKLDW